MASIKVVAGDLDEGTWQFSGMFGSVTMHRASTKDHFWVGETIDLKSQVASVEQVTEANVKKLAGAAGWGVVGLALLGPLGAIGGMLIGGNKKQVTFACHLKDGRKFLATTDGDTWTKIMAAHF